MLKNGLYEQIINEQLEQEIKNTNLQTETAKLDKAEAANVS